MAKHIHPEKEVELVSVAEYEAEEYKDYGYIHEAPMAVQWKEYTMPDAYITLTQRMLSKSEINANKTVQQFLLEDFGMEYTDKFFENRNKLTVIGE